VVDHIVPRSVGGSTWDRANWQGLSKVCHDAKTRREMGWGDANGRGTRQQPSACRKSTHRVRRAPSSVVTGDFSAG
jgi:hypothetical protein